MAILLFVVLAVGSAILMAWHRERSQRCPVCREINPGTNHVMKHLVG